MLPLDYIIHSLRRCALASLITIGMIAPVVAGGPVPQERDSREQATRVELLREGAALYEKACVDCHGAKGDGHGPKAGNQAVPDFSAPIEVARLSDEHMAKAVRERHGAAAAVWRTASSAEIAAVITYIRENFMLPSAFSDVSLGKRLYARNCSVCHGDRGNGASWARYSLNPPPFDFTSAKAKDLTRTHMLETVMRGRPTTAMVGFTTKLTPKQIAAVVDYVRAAFIEGDPVAATLGENADVPAPLPQDSPSHHTAAAATPLAAISAAPATRTPDHPEHQNHAEHGGVSGDMSAPLPFTLVGDPAHGRILFDQNCVACHGKKGDGAGPRAYFIEPKPENFTSASARGELNRPHLFNAISKGVNGTVMPAWEKVLTPQQIADIAEYVFTTFIRVADATHMPAMMMPASASERDLHHAGNDARDSDATVGHDPGSIHDSSGTAGRPLGPAKKKLAEREIDRTQIERGRAVYNFRCYFCHGYNGNARTIAARYLSPQPRDFTASRLSASDIITAVRDGRSGTAMKSFRGVIGDGEIADVAAFVSEEFVRRKAINTDYHTAENGWPDHRARYGAAYPFVLGQLSPLAPPESLTEEQQAGLRLFRQSCTTCHDLGNRPIPVKSWRIPGADAVPAAPAPKSDNGSSGGYGYGGSYGGGYGDSYGDGYGGESAAVHDKPPVLAGLAAKERRGKRLYQRACAYCHAADGTAENSIGEFLQPHPTDFTKADSAAMLSDERLDRTIRNGVPQTSMPAFAMLDAKERAAIIAYLRRAFLSTAKKQPRAGTTEEEKW